MWRRFKNCLIYVWKKYKFVPDIKSYAVLLEGWVERCNFLRLNEVYLEMQGEGFEPDVVTMGSLSTPIVKLNTMIKLLPYFRKRVAKI